MAKKIKTVFFCTNCGSTQPKWSGKCPDCGEWNCMVEEKVVSGSKSSIRRESKKPVTLSKITGNNFERIVSDTDEFDRVLGGGFVPGSVVLLGGEPGIGKSTVMLQILQELRGERFLYFSGEESDGQIKLRATRLGINDERILISCENNLEQILNHIDNNKPSIAVIDSIQTVYSDTIDNVPGSVTQVRECAGKLLRCAKENNIVLIFIGHITKDGMIAGPKILEHLVDAVLYLEGDNKNFYRILRAIKNRFGSTNEVGIFEMKEKGLAPVTNPTDYFLSERMEHIAGSSVAVSMEGTRPFLIEIQGLVTNSTYGNPQRNANGIDYRRLAMLIAVLEKRAGLPLSTQDIFLNLVGGLKIDEPAINMGIIAGLASSYYDTPLDARSVFIGEVGLVGEVRSVPFIEERIKESLKFGYEKIYIPSNSLKTINEKLKTQVTGIESITNLFKQIF